MKTLVHVSSDPMYASLEQQVAERVASLKGPLFTTDAPFLMEKFLFGLLEDHRQHYNCSCCRHFLQKYGQLVTIDEKGTVRSALFNGIFVPFFQRSLDLMIEAVENTPINGVFMNDAAQWGTPRTGDWTHLSGVPKLLALKTASQISAEKYEDYKMLRRALSDYGIEVAKQAVRVLEADALDRSEKTLGNAKWFLKLHETLDGVRDQQQRGALVWLAVATAPAGFTHIRANMIHTLFDAIMEGKSFEVISAEWAKKMHPLQYQRPTAAPKDGAIKRANELFDKLGLAPSLPRRFAKLEEVVAFWKPAPKLLGAVDPSGPSGVFDFLKQKPEGIKEVELPAVTLTWEKFLKNVLYKAPFIELQVPTYGSYFGMVTAVNPDSPPILQWDSLENRNQVSWFFFNGGSTAERWNLPALSFVPVNAICHKPPHWSGDFTKHGHQGFAVFLVLEGARLREPCRGGLFPEILRSELHEVRSVIEAYSNRTEVTGLTEASANGYALQKGNTYNITLRVNGKDLYKIDRWE